MKKSLCYLFLLFLNVSFLSAEAVVLESSIEKQNTQDLDFLAQSSNITPAESLSENLPVIDNSTEEVAVLDYKSLSMQPNSLSKPLSSQDLKTPIEKIKTPHKNASLAVSLSALLPGLGHIYLGDYNTASRLFGSSAIGIGAMFNEQTSYPGMLSLRIATSYGIYAAYRDVRSYNNNIGYSYKMPTDSFKEVSLAPFNLRVLKKPEVWGGLLGSLAVAAGVSYLSDKMGLTAHCSISPKYSVPLTAFTAGLSEELLFRGCLQSALSEKVTPLGGIILSSLAFGAAHIPNADDFSSKERKSYYTFSIPFITSIGAYLGWVTYKNKSLQESIALHTWYDLVVMALGSASDSAMIGKANVSFSFSF